MGRISRDSLRALLEPRSIAVVGASSDASKAGGRPIWYMQALGYRGAVYPVNPGRREIAGLPCYPSLRAIDRPIDLAVIAVPEAQVEAALLECAAIGVRGAVVFTSGFAEVGEAGRQRQARLAEIAQAHDLALCGPNCLGLINVATGAAPTFTTALERRPELPLGRIGFVTQSGAIGAFVLAMAQDQAVGLSHFVATGNEAVLGFADFARELIDDPGTRVIAGYLEGVDGPALVEVARTALARRKPLVLMKVGASAAGASAAATHTGKLAGVDAVYDAAFRQHGIVRARTIEELLDFSLALAEAPLPLGKRAGIVSISGGAAVLMADGCDALGLEVPPFAPATIERLRAALPWFATPANPLDTTGRPLWDAGMLQAAIEAVAADPAIDLVLLHIGLAPGPARRIATEIVSAARTFSKPLLVCWLPEMDTEARAMLRQAELPVYTDPIRAVRAADVLRRYAEFRSTTADDRPPTADGPSATARPSPAPPPLPEGPIVAEYEAKRWLAVAGIPVTRQAMAHKPADAVAHAEAIGYPVCLKVVSPEIPHRSDIGAVRLGLGDAASVETASLEIVANARRAVPDARIDGVVVQEMVSGGVELLVSGFRDPTFGPAVMCGLGGALVEVLRDTAIRLAPVSIPEARAMLGELRGAALFGGVRGAPPLDVAAAAEVISRLAALMAAVADLQTIEVNPLAVLEAGRGVRALDALITRQAEADRRLP